METLTLLEVQRLLSVNSQRTALAQLAKWEIKPITSSPDDEMTWPADQVHAKIYGSRFPPGTLVYWREDDKIHLGEVEAVTEHMRSVRTADGTLLYIHVARLVEVL